MQILHLRALNCSVVYSRLNPSQWYQIFALHHYTHSSTTDLSQGKTKRTRKFAEVKRLLSPRDIRLYVIIHILLTNIDYLQRLPISYFVPTLISILNLPSSHCSFTDNRTLKKRKEKNLRKRLKRSQKRSCRDLAFEIRRLTTSPPEYRPKTSSALFFTYNTSLGPPYQVLIDTNFINFSIQNKLEVVQAMMDCLLAKSTILAPNEMERWS